MSIHPNIGGVSKTMIAGSAVNIDGVWRNISSVHCNVDGVWKKAFENVFKGYVATGGNGVGTSSFVVLSTNGTDWTRYSTNISAKILDIAYGNGKWMCVTYGGVYSSTDCKTWTLVRSTTLGQWITFINGYFYTSERNASSTYDLYRTTGNGTFTKVISGSGSNFSDVAVTGSYLFTYGGSQYRSSDGGASWSVYSSYFNTTILRVFYLKDRLIGLNGKIGTSSGSCYWYYPYGESIRVDRDEDGFWDACYGLDGNGIGRWLFVGDVLASTSDITSSGGFVDINYRACGYMRNGFYLLGTRSINYATHGDHSQSFANLFTSDVTTDEFSTIVNNL